VKIKIGNVVGGVVENVIENVAGNVSGNVVGVSDVWGIQNSVKDHCD